MRSLSTLILTCLLCFSCTVNKKTESIEISAQFLQSDSLITSAAILCSFNDTLIIRAKQSDYLYHKYKIVRDSLKQIGKLVKRGIGPDELLMDNGGLVNKQNHRLMAYESNSSRAFEIIDRDSAVEYRPIHAFKQPGQTFIMRAAYRNDSNLLACLINTPEQDSWFGNLNINSGQLTILDSFYPDDCFNGPILTKQWLYNSGARLKKHPTNDWYAYTCDEGLYLEIFKIIDNRIVERKVLLDQYPQYHVDQDGVTPTGFPDDQLMGMQIDVTKNAIYVTFSDMTHHDFRAIASGINVEKLAKPGMKSGMDNHLYIFDWEGNLLQKYELSHPVGNIASSESDKEIFGITETEDQDYQVVRYIIP